MQGLLEAAHVLRKRRSNCRGWKEGHYQMSNKKRAPAGDRRIRVRGVRRNPPDLKKLSRALIALAVAQAQAEADAQAVQAAKKDAEDHPGAA
jgi:hypothetical protein